MLIISHRGAKGLAPENTQESFEAALESNADYIDFDVSLTLDEVLVVSHDPWPDLDYKELKKVNPDILTFNEVCELLGNKKPYWIDIKPSYNIDLVVEEISKTQLPKDTILASFDFKILKALRKRMLKVNLDCKVGSRLPTYCSSDRHGSPTSTITSYKSSRNRGF